MPRSLHAVKTAEAQPDYSTVLLKCHVASLLDDGIIGQLPLVLSPLVDNDELVLI
jgi:hypothetical protein